MSDCGWLDGKGEACGLSMSIEPEHLWAAIWMLDMAADWLRSNQEQPTAKEAYAEYLKTPGWKKTRRRALDRAARKCQLCSGTARLEVHHNTYERLGDELDTDLIVLCRECHSRHHGTSA